MPLVSVKSTTVTNKEKELNSPEDLFRHANEEDADIEDRDENNELFQLD
jgi:regulatory protein YycH of two-component signal transduction system YycFG